MERKIEGDLLFYCLNIGNDGERAARLKQLTDSDWDEVILRSRRNFVTPLLYHFLRMNNTVAYVPTGVMQRLREICFHSAEKNMRLYYELSKVLRILHNDDVAVIVTKGAALAELVYQNIALRPMADVDLLAKGEDIWKVDSVLTQLGYKSNAATLLSKRHAEWAQHIEYENGTTCIEVHPARIYELPRLDPWENAFPAKIASIDALILGPEDMLLHLCLHLDRHRINERSTALIWWFDVARVLEHHQGELDWDYVMRVAEKHQARRAIYHLLHLVNRWFDGPVPANVLSWPEGCGRTISINDVLRFTKGPILDPRKPELDSFLSYISRVPSIHDKIYHILRGVFPCREYVMHRYSKAPAKSIYFCYFAHMRVVATRVVKAFCQLRRYLRDRRISPWA